MGFLYIIQLREFITLGAKVYKIGRTERKILRQSLNHF
jgi:hypothetical protein